MKKITQSSQEKVNRINKVNKVNKEGLHQAFIFIVIGLMIVITLSSPILKNGMNLPKYYKQAFEEAEVTEILSESLEEDQVIPGMMIGKQRLTLKVLTGPYKGNVYESVNLLSRGHNVLAHEGLHIVVGLRETDEGVNAWVYNHKRQSYLYVLVALFFILLLAFGGLKGLKAALSLLFTGVMLVFVMIPLIFQGHSPVWVSIICTTIIAIISFILIGGFERKTLSAILGTLIGITCAGILSYIFGGLVNVSGMNMDKGEQLIYIAQDYQIQIHGLMFASILIASLGAVMDVSMSIASSMQEIKANTPTIPRRDLLKSGLVVGRDIMGTMANTLILAFAGGSLSLILLIWGYQMDYRQMINMPFISIEVIQGLSGSIGIILTVPFTALVSAWLYNKKDVSTWEIEVKKKSA